jgi:hypothetical protein
MARDVADHFCHTCRVPGFHRSNDLIDSLACSSSDDTTELEHPFAATSARGGGVRSAAPLRPLAEKRRG